ncbi:SURF1 family protein [Frigoribacterium sp. 2-23]|uniref:SURF1 family cytochrome oxidase biogenesis protein n=1 Tax=Frigoribacterium sp. 2-23 TaxID=3415006 RepID=UPI003C7039C4
MEGWRFALSKKWLGYLGVAVVFAIVCAFLAHWQWTRHEEKMAVVAQLEQRYDATPIPLDDALPTLASYDSALEWQPVTMTGRYLADETMLVRNRPFNGQPGFEVLVPLQTTSGDVFVVDRGWLPTGNAQDAPDAIPPAPSGEVTVTARIKPGEPRLNDRTDIAGTNQIATIQLADIQKRLDRPTYTAAYGLVMGEDPAPAVAPAPSVEPQIDEGLNLSYFIQWLMFGLGAFAFLFYVIRQEHRNQNADDDEKREHADERARKRAARPRADHEIEDEILDAAGR